MTDEEYKRLFTWSEYKQVHTRGGRIVHVFEEKSLPSEFKMGAARFVLFLRNGFRPQYKDEALGISLTIDCPQCKDRHIDTPAYWVASTPSMGPVASRHRRTPMMALAALRDDLLEIVTKGQQAQKSYDLVQVCLEEIDD